MWNIDGFAGRLVFIALLFFLFVVVGREAWIQFDDFSTWKTTALVFERDLGGLFADVKSNGGQPVEGMWRMARLFSFTPRGSEEAWYFEYDVDRGVLKVVPWGKAEGAKPLVVDHSRAVDDFRSAFAGLVEDAHERSVE